jgi:acyl-CoA thioesterase II
MSEFAEATRVEGGAGRYRAALAPEWFAWGPMGGYVAAIALRAIAATATQPRPATFACQFLRAGRAGPAEVEVESLRAGRRSEALRATLAQDGKPLLAATAWFVAEDLDGFAHDEAVMPSLPAPEALRSYAELAPNYAEWFPMWRYLDGRPSDWRWGPGTGPAVWRTWMRLLSGAPGDALVDAARTVLWADMLPWNAAVGPHEWPRRYIAPNLDLTVQFHAAVPHEEWILCDGLAPVAAGGLVGCHGRLWARDGRLVATATAQLLCVPNPTYAEEVEERRKWDAEHNGTGDAHAGDASVEAGAADPNVSPNASK